MSARTHYNVCEWGLKHMYMYMGPDERKPDIVAFEKNKGTDQPEHLHSLISAFVFN